MSKGMGRLVPGGPASAEYEISRSRFIASAAAAFSVEEARAFVASIRRKYPDATHNVPAFVIGEGNSVSSGCSDDGEPSGTAGRPVLSVLSASEFTNVVVVVTRYFGGIKLGAGGLVRAYSESAKRVLAVLPKASVELVSLFSVSFPYSFYDGVVRIASDMGVEIAESSFSDRVELEMLSRTSDYAAFRDRVADFTAGRASFEIHEENRERIVGIR